MVCGVLRQQELLASRGCYYSWHDSWFFLVPVLTASHVCIPDAPLLSSALDSSPPREFDSQLSLNVDANPDISISKHLDSSEKIELTSSADS
jgi:hypothetical protein